VLVTAADSALLLIDLQAKLVPALADGEVIVARAVRLAEAARLLDVPIRATEQYPAGLGPTVPELAGYPSATLAKTAFSAARDPDFPGLLPAGVSKVVIAGCEAHVCVQQTVADLLEAGREVYLVTDAVGSRFADDKARRAGAGTAARRAGRDVGDGAVRVAGRLAAPVVPRRAEAAEVGRHVVRTRPPEPGAKVGILLGALLRPFTSGNIVSRSSGRLAAA
jgi:nicotinamidase-related amidase